MSDLKRKREDEEDDAFVALPPDMINNNDEAEQEAVVVLPPPKKQKILKFAKVYLKLLPNANMYEKSFMHRSVVTQIVVAERVNFIITACKDGHVKFWKKNAKGVEFVKHFRAHLQKITSMRATSDDSLLATTSEDQTVKIFEIINFGTYQFIIIFIYYLQ